MPNTRFPELHTNPTRFMVGILALLLVCGAALLGSGTADRSTVVKGHSLWNAGAEVPLLNIATYPKDFKRNTDPRWRQQIAGDDLYDLDPPDAHLHHAAFSVTATLLTRTLLPRSDLSAFPETHRPQAARAPPLV